MKSAIATFLRRVRTVASLAPYSLLAIAELVHSQTIEHTIPRRALRSVGPRVFVPPDVSFRYPKSIELGADVSLGAGDRIWASPNARIVIGAHALIGPNVTILSANHTFDIPDVPIRSQPEEERDVTIGEMAWIGAGAVILPGVTIGDGAIVAAGAVVAADVEAYTVVGGVPARLIRNRDERLSQKKTGG